MTGRQRGPVPALPAMGFPWVALILALLTGTGCDPASSGAPDTAIVRDSADIRIVENLAPRWGEGDGWTLDAEPLVSIGMVEGETPYMLSQVRAPRRLPDGSIAFLDGSSRELRFFDEEGRHLRSVGREGSGPGEFQFPIWLEAGPGDSLVVWDAGPYRATVFSLEGELEGTFTLEDLPGTLRLAQLRGVFPDGDVLARGSLPLEAMRAGQTGPRWSSHLLVRYPPDGREPVVLGQTESVQCDPARDGECSFLAYGALRGFQLQDDQIYVGLPDLNEIQVLDSRGELRARIHGAEPLQPVTEAMRREFRDAVLAGNPDREAQVRGFLDASSFAEVVPAFGRFLVSTDRHIWVEEYRVDQAPWGYPRAFPPRTAPVRWTVYDPDGILLGDVEVPVELTAHEIGADYVLGVARDELDVEMVRLYRVLKP